MGGSGVRVGLGYFPFIILLSSLCQRYACFMFRYLTTITSIDLLLSPHHRPQQALQDTSTDLYSNAPYASEPLVLCCVATVVATSLYRNSNRLPSPRFRLTSLSLPRSLSLSLGPSREV